MTNQREVEATLIITADNPQVVAQQIAGLTSLAHYRLRAQAHQPIHDVYLDTPDKALQSQKIALRIRALHGTHWITLKGPSQATAGGGIERLESEALWSQDALAQAVQALLSKGIELPRRCTDFDPLDPLKVMVAVGLTIIQDRETHRQARDIVPMSAERPPVLAELGIDSVTYRCGDQKIGHHEIEIEAKVRDDPTVLGTTTESLLSMYGPKLRRWPHSKLATGRAIDAVLREEGEAGLLDPHNHLKPASYERIQDYLTSGRN